MLRAQTTNCVCSMHAVAVHKQTVFVQAIGARENSEGVNCLAILSSTSCARCVFGAITQSNIKSQTEDVCDVIFRVCLCVPTITAKRPCT